MNKINLQYKGDAFDALLLKGAMPTLKLVFAAGAGGNPERHLPLLSSFAERGCTVIAPYFERIISPMPSSEELLLRANLIVSALDFLNDLNLPTAGVGHSIGATLLAGLAGGQMWQRSGERLPIAKDGRLQKLVLFTPPTGFFQAPNALEALRIPMQVWAGSLDTITPTAQMEALKASLPSGVPVDLRVVEGAGHFSFMNTLPPNVSDTLENREEFLSKLFTETFHFLTT